MRLKWKGKKLLAYIRKIVLGNKLKTMKSASAKWQNAYEKCMASSFIINCLSVCLFFLFHGSPHTIFFISCSFQFYDCYIDSTMSVYSWLIIMIISSFDGFFSPLYCCLNRLVDSDQATGNGQVKWEWFCIRFFLFTDK